ncbi:MAG: hypothetical protein V4509_04400 [Patescibacteria group bacterium]
MKPLSFLLDICPIVGGFKMIIEAFFKKEMTGTILVGNARFMHLVFGIISLILDGFTGIGGSVTRALGKGFITRWAEWIGSEVAVKAIAKASQSRLKRMGINFLEAKIRKGVEHKLGDIKGYRYSNKNREEIRKKYGVDIKNKNDLKDISAMSNGGEKIKDIKKSQKALSSDKAPSKREEKIAAQQAAKKNASGNPVGQYEEDFEISTPKTRGEIIAEQRRKKYANK